MTQKEQQRLLLEQGMKDYVDALNAIKEFRSLIQRECRRVIEDNLEEYAAALGTKLSKDAFMDFEWSDGTGTKFNLGVKCVFKDGGYKELCHGIWWERADGGGLETGISIWVWSRRKSIAKLKDVLRREDVVCDEDGDAKVVSLTEEMTAENVASIDTKLDKLMEGWITLWSKVGGIKALGGKSS